MKNNRINIILFGCSYRAVELEKICAMIPEMEIIGYVDNDSKKWGTEYLGRIVYSISEFMEICREDKEIVIITVLLQYSAAIQQLIQLKIENDICFCLYEFIYKYNLLQKYESFIVKDEILSDADILIVSNNGFPKTDDLYRSGFVFQRLKAYREQIKIDALGFVNSQYLYQYEYDGIRIYEGRENALLYLLINRKYKKILVHFASPELYYLLEHYAKDIPLICWIHGYEILPWDRRRFNYKESEIQDNKMKLEQDSLAIKSFWKRFFERKRTKFVFVSHWLKRTVEEDIGYLPEDCHIIPNYIDDGLFHYYAKEPADVSKILLIKSNKARVYANDIAANVILMLSQRPCFEKLEFQIYGTGNLFEENYSELQKREYANVHIHPYFITQSEIAVLHKENGIFLCPTRQDTQGVSMCEAMDSGMVVITNHVAAVPEYINNECGILCEDENVLQMADAIEWLTNHTDDFLKYSRNASQYMQVRCGYKNTIQKEMMLIMQD